MFKTLWISAIACVFMAGSVMAEITRGPVTNLPMPRFVSLKASTGNVRRGPSLSHRIDWIYQRRNLPLQVVAEHGHWRRVVDIEGAGGWIHYALLSGTRTVIVTADLLTAHQRRDPTSDTRAIFEKGVVAKLGECDLDWCWIKVEGNRGWVEKRALWGVAMGEIRE
ncbi:MAG: SH3 domain-containing protein [Planktomarina sp.]